MEAIELYMMERANGMPVGRAQWIVGNRLLRGFQVEKNEDEAEKWFLRAWDNRFPGTANTQAFVLTRKWLRYINAKFSKTPRLLSLLTKASISSDEKNGTILLPVFNDAQEKWIDSKLQEIRDSFRGYTEGYYSNITIDVTRTNKNND